MRVDGLKGLGTELGQHWDLAVGSSQDSLLVALLRSSGGLSRASGSVKKLAGQQVGTSLVVGGSVEEDLLHPGCEP